MNIFFFIKDKILTAVKDELLEKNDSTNLFFENISVEPPRDKSFGDISTNAAMILAKHTGNNPKLIATQLINKIPSCNEIVSMNIAGPGFINFKINNSVWFSIMDEVLSLGTSYGSNRLGEGKLINVEYVSANPTGPLHVGHARGGVFGDALANLLSKSGYEVTKEYYINDSGSQVYSLGRAVYFRYLEQLGVKDSKDVESAIKSGQVEYGGEYVKDIASSLIEKYKDKWISSDEKDWLEPITDFAIKQMLSLIKYDLDSLGIKHDIFISEKRIVKEGKVNKAVKNLDQLNLLYTGILEPPKGKVIEDWEPREQLLFRSTKFGDDVDRPVSKSDGSWTYFASDIAYHQDKIDRGFKEMINIWGADHSGYVKRIKSSVTALSSSQAHLDVKLCKLVKLFDKGKPIKMSKRSGTFITLRELVDSVGKDVVRFIMLTRKNDVSLDFDFSKVLEKSRDNPVFYVQYAYARIYSVFRHASQEISDNFISDDNLKKANFSNCILKEELTIMKLIASWPRIIELSTNAHEPHRIVFYLYELASAFHVLWNKGNENAELRFLNKDNLDISLSRLALIKCVSITISSGLEILDVTPVEEMR